MEEIEAEHGVSLTSEAPAWKWFVSELRPENKLLLLLV